MKEITTRGNLPKHLQVMAKEVEGQRSTLFFECNTADELLQLAADGKCEETSVTIDRDTSKGFMVAFSFTDSAIEDLTGNKLIVMNIYFTELTDQEALKYKKMLHTHRQEQETAHSNWKNKGKQNDK